MIMNWTRIERILRKKYKKRFNAVESPAYPSLIMGYFKNRTVRSALGSVNQVFNPLVSTRKCPKGDFSERMSLKIADNLRVFGTALIMKP